MHGPQTNSTTRICDSDDDDDSDAIPLTRPSASMSDITELVAQALAAERGALDCRLAELERKQNKFMETTANLEQKLNIMRKQIVEATVKGTISVLTGSTSPFATIEDTQTQRKENANKFQSINEGLSSTNNGLAVLQQHMTLLLQRTEQMFLANHDPDIASPPRAITNHQANSHMTDMEGAGES
jgi:chromosome segregation ATPase